MAWAYKLLAQLSEVLLIFCLAFALAMLPCLVVGVILVLLFALAVRSKRAQMHPERHAYKYAIKHKDILGMMGDQEWFTGA